MAKQAVVIIHGIGEQKPMQTLRGFVEAIWTRDESIHHEHGSSDVWSKPDDVSDSFELRRLTTGKNKNGIRTDFFELYWAHLMHGTTLTHVTGWARFLLLRKPSDIPPALRGVYWLLIVAFGAAAFFAVNAAMSEESRLIQIPAWLSLAFGAVILPGAGQVIRSIVGDAARYLYPAPTNIQRRHEIRRAGVDLLRDLHKRNYDRIIIVGHSLGTVIGYDIIKYYWAEVHRDIDASKPPKFEKLEKLESIAKGEHGHIEIDEIQHAQREYFEEFRENGNNWRITDFVTLGSPLTHADILLADDEADREDKQQARELPICLPALETDRNGKRSFSFSYTASYEKDGKPKKRKVKVPHHAAIFAVTRWTNLYFPARAVIKGDVIAGPLAQIFGDGVRDVIVQTDQRGGYLTHTLYWKASAWADPPEPHIAALREALDLADERNALANGDDAE